MIETTYTLSEDDFQEASKLWCKKEVKKLPGHSLVLGLGVIFGGLLGHAIGHTLLLGTG